MKAFTYENAHTLENFQVELREVPEPVLQAQDLLVRVRAFAFNPVDYKIRSSRSGGVILGWDAAGVVEQVGPDARGFQVGDEVYYAGDLFRPGSHAQLQAIDHRLVARKPANLSFAEAAAVPLTALTAWEALFERGFEPQRVLIIGGAGGVGSMAVQLLKAKTDAHVIATASRPETQEWVRSLGADLVIGRDLQVEPVDLIFSTTHTAQYLKQLPDLLRPFGHLVLIDDPETLDIAPFKSKSLAVHWEFMFTKSAQNYRPESQGQILDQVARLIERGRLRTTLKEQFEPDLENYRRAHQQLESGQATGKMVMHW